MIKFPYSIFFASIVLSHILACSPNSQEGKKDIPPGPIKVEIKKEGNKYVLFRDGKVYHFNGAGLEYGDIQTLKAHNGTSFRTWRTDNSEETGQEILDKALDHGMTVTMCLEVMRERHGFDYDNPEEVEQQFQKMKDEVLKYKDHPALLMWAIGNELNLGYKNPKVYDAVNQISKMIHEVDPYHPTTTTVAGINKELVDVIKTRAPDIDVLGIQLYGAIVNLPKYIEETNWTKPYMITEWGTLGHWEVNTTKWGAPIEQTSTVKAIGILERYRKAIEPYSDQCIGSYVFLWGQKQERTPTWYGLFLDSGEETETIDVMHYIWNGRWPENRSPRLDDMRLNAKTADDNIYLVSGDSYPAKVTVFDFDGDDLTYRWDIKPESTDLKEGGDYEETPKSLTGLIQDASNDKIEFRAPEKDGPYRLFVYAYDGNGHAAHANIPFYVNQ